MITMFVAENSLSRIFYWHVKSGSIKLEVGGSFELLILVAGMVHSK
jgi:hypothetical protein